MMEIMRIVDHHTRRLSGITRKGSSVESMGGGQPEHTGFEPRRGRTRISMAPLSGQSRAFS
jgi:hypothetical protein